VSLHENQELFLARRDAMASEAPAGRPYVVIADGRVIGYFDSLTAAMSVWAEHSGAVIEDCAGSEPAVVASNFRAPHTF